MTSLTVIYASTSGHTEYVIQELQKHLAQKAKNLAVTIKRVELTKPEDLVSGDFLLLASGTWNTGGTEGQLNPHMHNFVNGTSKAVKLNGKKTAIIALGDQRYKYTARAGEHLKNFIETHGGIVLGEPLTIVNEPYGQETKIQKWADQLLTWIK